MIQQPSTLGIHDVIFARRPDSTKTWAAPREISSASGPYFSALLEVAANGTAVATWLEDNQAPVLHAAIFE
jgi:hypothetical protein